MFNLYEMQHIIKEQKAMVKKMEQNGSERLLSQAQKKSRNKKSNWWLKSLNKGKV